jgi:hypothetical protein
MKYRIVSLSRSPCLATPDLEQIKLRGGLTAFYWWLWLFQKQEGRDGCKNREDRNDFDVIPHGTARSRGISNFFGFLLPEVPRQNRGERRAKTLFRSTGPGVPVNLVLVISGLRPELVPFCLDRWRGPDDQDETVTIQRHS